MKLLADIFAERKDKEEGYGWWEDEQDAIPVVLRARRMIEVEIRGILSICYAIQSVTLSLRIGFVVVGSCEVQLA